jgi:membrane protein implicated in regulation of membrane protease activity
MQPSRTLTILNSILLVGVIAWLASQIFLTSDYPLAFKVIYGILIAFVSVLCILMWKYFGRASGPPPKPSNVPP